MVETALGWLVGLWRELRNFVEFLLPLRWFPMMRLSERVETGHQGLPGTISVEIFLENLRADADYRVQVIDVRGINTAQRPPGWHPRWQEDPDAIDLPIVRGGVGHLNVVVTRNDGSSTDLTPRVFEFPDATGTEARSWLSSLPSEAAALSAPASAFVQQAVALQLRLSNRRIHRSELWELAFWVTPSFTLGTRLEQIRGGRRS